MQRLRKLVDIVWERKLDIERVFNYFAVNDKSQTCVAITTDDNRILSNSCFLPLPNSVYQELKTRWLDSPLRLKNLSIEILHPLQTKLLEGANFFLTFEELENFLKLQIQLDYHTRVLKKTKETFVYNKMLNSNVMPRGFEKNKTYFQITQIVRKKTIKELMDEGRSAIEARIIYNYRSPEPAWAKLGTGIFTVSKKYNLVESILIDESIDLESILDEFDKINLNTNLHDSNKVTFQENHREKSSSEDYLDKGESHLAFDKFSKHMRTEKRELLEYGTFNDIVEECEKVCPELNLTARKEIVLVLTKGRGKPGPKKKLIKES